MLLQKWYSSAIYCLNSADFMRRHDIRTVQAIAILAICFNNFGDSGLFMTMWPCAIRIAQKLEIDKNTKPIIGGLKQSCYSRLWWTLVICEWYESIPFVFKYIHLLVI